MKLKNRAIILAAGSSKRMGSQKMLLPFRETTILEMVIQNVLSSNIDSVLVILGADQAQIAKVINPWPVEVCINKKHESGILSSVLCGFDFLPDDTGNALVFLGDQPGIPPWVSNTIIEAYNDSLHGIVIPLYKHHRGYPLLVDFKYRRDIGRLDLEKGLRSLRHLFPEDVLEVEVDEPGILLDINTPEDYAKAKKSL